MKEEQRKRAQQLRKNLTKEEKKLWYGFLRQYPVQFRRQVPFGPYIVDFYCYQAKLIVEVDGGQHYEAEPMEYDARRTAYLEKTCGVTVLRVSNLEVQKHFEGVCTVIRLAVEKNMPSPLGD